MRWSPAFGETHDRNQRLAMVVEGFCVRQKASMTQSTAPLLKAENLSVARGDALLIEGLSFTVNPGEALHVQGENGAGKSTLMLALAGLIPLVAGKVELNRDALAFLGHDNGLLPDLSVAENLSLYAGCGVVPAAGVAELLGLHELKQKPARTLSFGQARRVALALTCLPDKKVWMLDEPFAGLDQQTSAALETILHQGTTEGRAILFSSHERSLNKAHTMTLTRKGSDDV